MISKKLLSKILEVKVLEEPKMHLIRKQELCYWTTLGLVEVNIHELAFKCKEWAWNKDYGIFSAVSGKGAVCMFGLRKQTIDSFKSLNGNTEPEAIFKVCEWILKKES